MKVWVFIRIPAIPVILFEWDAEGESLREVRLRVQLQAKTNLGIELIAKEFSFWINASWFWCACKYSEIQWHKRRAPTLIVTITLCPPWLKFLPSISAERVRVSPCRKSIRWVEIFIIKFILQYLLQLLLVAKTYLTWVVNFCSHTRLRATRKDKFQDKFIWKEDKRDK